MFPGADGRSASGIVQFQKRAFTHTLLRASAASAYQRLWSALRQRWTDRRRTGHRRCSSLNRKRRWICLRPVATFSPSPRVRHSFGRTGHTATTPGIDSMAGAIARARAGSENLTKKEPDMGASGL